MSKNQKLNQIENQLDSIYHRMRVAQEDLNESIKKNKKIKSVVINLFE